MGTWTGTDQEAEEIIQTYYENEYEKLVRCAAVYLKTKNNQVHILNRAEDLVQETFALGWERRQDVLSCEKPVGWLYGTLHNKARELLRNENKWTKRLLQYRQLYTPKTDPYVNLELKLELDDLIPKEDYDLLYKLYVEGYSYQELCEETGLTKSVLGGRVHRIKKKMKEQMKE